ncbi:MAG: hypothetical protein KAY24_12755 [Candidatus Eisenbacteria sp.]|nr:hypothetical protein [Candidatus Eisenbacteria bacterium]
MDGRHMLSAAGALLALIVVGWTGCGISTDGPTGGTTGKDGVKIEGLAANDITDTSAVITWSTSPATFGTLRYGTDPKLATYRTLSSTLQAQHNLELCDLEASTIYHLMVHATNATGDTASERGEPFQTKTSSTLNDTTPPIITDIEVVGVTSCSAEIRWTTDDKTRGKLTYGLNPPLDLESREYPEDATKYTYGHALILTDLLDDTTYHFAIEVTNMAALSTSTTDDLTFHTLAMPTLGFCPDTIEASPGELFDLVVCIANVQDLHGIAMTIVFSPSAMEVLSVSRGPFYSNLDLGYGHFWNEIWQPSGRVLVEATWGIEYVDHQPVGTLADGDGNICTIHCRLKEGTGGTSVSFIEYDSNSDGKDDTRLHDHNRLRISTRTRPGIIRLPSN